jgi:hypothetical protein
MFVSKDYEKGYRDGMAIGRRVEALARRRSKWVVERRTRQERKPPLKYRGGWSEWEVCSAMHGSETLAYQTMNEIMQEKPRTMILDYRIVRYDAST